MKNRLFFFLLSAVLSVIVVPISNPVTAQVGIGTNAPSSNSILDVSSPNKGIMLPRVNDTTNISSPSAGLMIYDKQTKTPAYHDGTKWNTVPQALNAAAPASGDSTTYTVTGATANSGFTNGTFALLNFSDAATSPVSQTGSGAGVQGRPNFQDLTLQKLLDINSAAFIRTFSLGVGVPTIELKVYNPGATTPYYSIKLSQVFITAFSVAANGSERTFIEKISVHAVTYGYKNWVSNKSFAWDTAAGTAVAY